jgi:hypothetical protein
MTQDREVFPISQKYQELFSVPNGFFILRATMFSGKTDSSNA